MTDTLSSLRDSIGELDHTVRETVSFDDQYISDLLLQVVMLEEVLAARWPRSIVLRRRWRRQVRASVRHMDGGTWVWRRLNALGTGWLEPFWAQPESRCRNSR